MRVAHFRLPIAAALALASTSSCLDFFGIDESSAPLPVCAEGCVQVLCSDSYFGLPGPPPRGSQFPVLRELGSPDCDIVTTDEAGRVTEYLCFGVATTEITYFGDTDLPATIVQTDFIQNGTIEQQLRFTMTWNADGELTWESVQTYLDGAWEGNEVSFEWLFADDGSVREFHEYTRFPEGNDPAEAGNHSQAFYTNDNVERAHRFQLFNAEGQLERTQELAGIDELLALETTYVWSDVGLLSVSTIRRVEESDEQSGCTKPDPEHIHCTAELKYDDNGALVSFIEAGNEYVVSDACCGSCVPASEAAQQRG